ncbi:hypothetical protein G4B88_031243, partial [Cannabis sativa]
MEHKEFIVCGWINRAKISSFKKKVLAGAVARLVYSIWHTRNEKIWNNKIDNVDAIVKKVQLTVKHRIDSLCPKKIRFYLRSLEELGVELLDEFQLGRDLKIVEKSEFWPWFRSHEVEGEGEEFSISIGEAY